MDNLRFLMRPDGLYFEPCPLAECFHEKTGVYGKNDLTRRDGTARGEELREGPRGKGLPQASNRKGGMNMWK